MKKYCTMLAVLLSLLCLVWVPGAGAAAPQLASSEAYCIIDADTGIVLAQQNMDHELYPASITKVMTLGLACEKAQNNWDQRLTVSHDAVYSLAGTGSTHIALLPGEEMPLRDILYGTMIESANDGANVLAEYVGGSIEGGVQAMNDRVAALGLQHTHFANPHGLSDQTHYTSCYDMAQILRWALQQPGFDEVFSRTASYTAEPTNLRDVKRYFNQQDVLKLSGNRYYVPEIVGSKLGYTDLARYTYVCLAEKDGVRLICTVMHSQLKTDKYRDVASLLDYAFKTWPGYTTVSAPEMSRTVTVYGGGDALGAITVRPAEAKVLLADGLDASCVQAVIEMPETYILGQPLTGRTVYTLNGGGIQPDGTFTAGLVAEGLEAVIDAAAGQTLAAAADLVPMRRASRLPLLALAGAGAVLGLLMWDKYREKKRRARRAAEIASADEPETAPRTSPRNSNRKE